MADKSAQAKGWGWSFIGLVLIVLSLFIIAWWLNSNHKEEDRKDGPKGRGKEEKEEKEVEFREEKEEEKEVEFRKEKKEEEKEEEKEVEFREEKEEEKEEGRVCWPYKKPSGSLPPKIPGKSVGESICCQVMEEMFGVPFSTVRPKFLRNPETGRNLELDCYNPELRIAVEYNGIQHYNWPNFTGQDKEGFIKQAQRDKLKVELCDRNQVLLITVPHLIKPKEIPGFLYQQIQEYYK